MSCIKCNLYHENFTSKNEKKFFWSIFSSFCDLWVKQLIRRKCSHDHLTFLTFISWQRNIIIIIIIIYTIRLCEVIFTKNTFTLIKWNVNLFYFFSFQNKLRGKTFQSFLPLSIILLLRWIIIRLVIGCLVLQWPLE